MEDVAVPAAQMGGGGRAVPAAAAQGLGEAGEAEQQQEIPKEGGWEDEAEDEGEAEGGGAMPIEAAQGGNESPGVAAHRSGEGEAEERQEIHRDLLCAAISGDSESMKAMVQHSRDPSILLGTTPSGNTCLHISSIHGHQSFCQDVITLEESLLSKYNLEQETPLVVAVTLGHTSLASLLLGCCHELGLRQAILEQDRDGFNALHHAIRNGHQGLALELIKVEPALSQGVSKCNQSPMFIAVMKDFTQIFEALVDIRGSAHVGQHGHNVLHAAVTNENSVVAAKIMERRPLLAKETDMEGYTPTGMAVIYNKVVVLRVLLKHDSSFGYEVDKNGNPLLCYAARRGHVGVARELLNHCPDALYRNVDAQKWTCLHIAVQNGHLEFVEFILRTPQLQKLVNMPDSHGNPALHYAIKQCDPRLVAALLSHKNTDTKMLYKNGSSVASELRRAVEDDTTSDWEEVLMLMLKSNTSSSPGGMDIRLMEAATSGDYASMKAMASQDPSILMGTTPHSLHPWPPRFLQGRS